MPIVRHHDAGLYYRDHGDRVGIGSFNHRRLPVAATGLDTHERREDGIVYAFTAEDFAEPWELTCELMPALRETTLERSFNGVFAFTPDGYPLIGEHPDLRGFWVGESVWVTHSAGVGRVLAETIIDGAPSIDASPADLSRFERPELDPAVFEARCDDSYRDVYAVHHPAEGHTSARDLRFSPFEPRQRELGAAFFDTAAWERPRWYEANARLVDAATVPPRDEWSSRYWSPIAIAEHLAVRERAGLFDMTALTRIEVSGPGAEAFLAWMVAGRIDRPVGTVTYSLLLDVRGGIRSDITVARVAEDRFVIGANGPRDLAWLRRHLPPDGSVTVTDLTGSGVLPGPVGTRGARHPGSGGRRRPRVRVPAGGRAPREGHPRHRAAGLLRGGAGVGTDGGLRRRARALGCADGVGGAVRRDRRRLGGAVLAAHREGLPDVGHRHDAGAHPGRGGAGVRRAHRRLGLPGARRPCRPAHPPRGDSPP